jgi:hypothetical protein
MTAPAPGAAAAPTAQARGRGRARRVALAALAAALAGCGTPSADLFVVERAGTLPDARLVLVVGDGGSVTCDGVERPITSAQLLDARALARDLRPLLERHARFPALAGAQLRFRVTGEDGDVRFADASAAREPVLGRVVAFTRIIAREACGRAR